MHPFLKSLLALQRAELEIMELERQLLLLPRERKTREEKLEELKKLWESKVERAKKALVEADRIDLDLKAREQEINKLQVRLNSAKSNAEYAAIQNQIKAYKEQNSNDEDKALELYEEVEELKREAKKEENAFRQEENVFKKFLEESAREEERIDKEIKELKKRKEEIERETPKEALEMYYHLMRYFNRHGGVVLSPVVHGVCKACGNTVLPNDQVKLLQGKEIVQCKGCSRILYLPEDAGMSI